MRFETPAGRQAHVDFFRFVFAGRAIRLACRARLLTDPLASNTAFPTDAPLKAAGNGNGFPAPPQCLHKLGRFGGSREEPRAIGEDVESASYQQFDRKRATSRRLLKTLLIECNSRRLHHFFLLESVVYDHVPGASSVFGRSFPGEFPVSFETPGASIIALNKSGGFSRRVPAPPTCLHGSWSGGGRHRVSTHRVGLWKLSTESDQAHRRSL